MLARVDRKPEPPDASDAPWWAPLLDADDARGVDEALRHRTTASFRCGEVTARLSYGGFAHDSAAQAWTTVAASLPITPLVFEVRPRRATTELAARLGLALDVRTGDAVFDGAYQVEAAPADLARAVLDAEVRRWMLKVFPAHVSFVGDRLEASTLEPREPQEERALVLLAATLIAGIPAAVREMEAGGAERVRDASGYRDGGALRDHHAARREALAALEAVRARRRRAGALAWAGLVLAAVADRIWG